MKLYSYFHIYSFYSRVSTPRRVRKLAQQGLKIPEKNYCEIKKKTAISDSYLDSFVVRFQYKGDYNIFPLNVLSYKPYLILRCLKFSFIFVLALLLELVFGFHENIPQTKFSYSHIYTFTHQIFLHFVIYIHVDKFQ